MMVLTFVQLRADPGCLDTATDVIANLEADITLEVEGSVIYEEVSFPVAELALALTRWAQSCSADRPDFEFDSMSAEEPGLVWIRRTEGGWRFGSICQDRPETKVFPTEQVDEAIRKYIGDLKTQVGGTFGPGALQRLVDALGSDQ